MCGICGKLTLQGADPIEPSLLRQMNDQLQHRGPDGAGEYLWGPVALGHRRLSIIDLNTGGQPISNEDGTIWVVYNGEIYNFPQLRADLEKRGHVFKSTTDTEVIVHLYEEFGPDSVNQLRGMFAFALWDQRTRSLLLARDRVGIKPLYYANTGRALVFASEIKSILVDATVARRINPRAIDRFLTYYYLPGDETLVEGVHKLPPGHFLWVQNGQIALRQYWDLEFRSREPSCFEEAVEELQSLLRRTVKDHMISDVPVGVLLSGGVDSTGILRYAVEQTSKPIRTFTVGFEGREFADERPYARLAAERYATVHQDITLTPEAFRDFLPRYAQHMEEPVCEPPAVALYFVSRLAREASVKVLLSGEGGDEAFGGYNNYRNLLWLETIKSAMGPAKPFLRAALGGLGRLGFEKADRYSRLIKPELADYYFSRTANPSTPFNQRKPGLYRQQFANQLPAAPATTLTRELFQRLAGKGQLDRMLYVDTKTWLPDDLLVKADKMTMATSVELRVPLLDHQVLEFAASLPGDYKVRGKVTKRVLKAALSGAVPTEILNRKKTGFPVPYDHWMRNELRVMVSDTLLNPSAAITDYFCPKEIASLVNGHQEGRRGAKEVFSLLVLELILGELTRKRGSLLN